MTAAAYRRDLRAIVRGYWQGEWNQSQVQDLLFNAVDRGLTKAWQDGAKQVGIRPDEITPNEQTMMMTAIFKEYSHVPSLIGFIQSNLKKDGGKLAVLYARLETWINRYLDVKNQAKLAAESDPKLKWVLGRTDHCSTCYKLAGKVKRASQWRAYGVRPQNPPNPNLECGGWRCACSLNPTTDPLSKGRLPSVP